MSKSQFIWGLAIAGLGLVAKAAPASANEWYFFVENRTSADITELYVSENNRTWGYFDIGSGIAVGETTKLTWDQSTNNESCTQWIKAVFSDKTQSPPQRFNFCQDLDTPIVFSE